MGLGLCFFALAVLSLFFLSLRWAWSESWSGGLLVLFSLSVSLLVLEVSFSFVSRSHGVSFTLASANWFRKHWHVNSLGFRDREHDPERASFHKRVLVLGDSFVAGHGIASPQDRFSDVLQTMLPPHYEVFNAGVNGADTVLELGTLKNFPFAPHILVLSYMINDIQPVAKRILGRKFRDFVPYSDIPNFLLPLVKRSHLLNYLYWTFPHAQNQNYHEVLIEAHGHPQVMKIHLNDLAALLDYAKSRSIRTVAVLFPALTDVERTENLVKPIAAFLEQRGVPSIDVTPLALRLPSSRRVVNANDQHASVELNAMIAGELLDRLRKLTPEAFQLPIG